MKILPGMYKVFEGFLKMIWQSLGLGDASQKANLLIAIVRFWKISLPTLWKVNVVGVGVSKGQNFLRKVWGLTGIFRGVAAGLKPKKLLWEGYGYFLKQHIPQKDYTVHKLSS